MCNMIICVILILFSDIYKASQKIYYRLKFKRKTPKFQQKASMKQFRYNKISFLLNKIIQAILHEHNPDHESDT